MQINFTMSYSLPIQLNLEGKLCVVVGGGTVATRKVISLLETGARVRVIAPLLSPELTMFAQRGKIEWRNEFFTPETLEGAKLVFAATDNRVVNKSVTEEAKRRDIMINVADAPETSDFTSLAVLRRGSLCLTVSTNGGSPALTAHILSLLETQFGEDWGEFAELLATLRDYIKESTLPQERPVLQRRVIAEEATFRECLRLEGRSVAIAEGKKMIELWKNETEKSA